MPGLRTLQRRLLLVILPVAVLVASCARDYVTGKRTISLMSESKEIELGRKADPEIVAQFGIYDDPKLAAFVDSVGQKLVRVSHRPTLKFTFRLLDSPVVNAFALPGGYVYFTRGIMAYFNTEAEMAGVMGHEIGHVAARHGAEQYTKAQLAGVGLALGSVLSPTIYRLSDLAQTGLGLLFLKFSRDDESEADRLGVEYSTRAGYDARSMAHFFETINRLSQKSGNNIPTFLSTHPNPVDREKTVAALSAEWQKKVPGPKGGTNRARYLHRIDGIVFGEDPRQGFVEGGYFYHPDLKFQFLVPSEWQTVNQPTQVQMVSPKKDAIIEFTLAKGASAQLAAESFVASSGATVKSSKKTKVNGMPAVMMVSDVQSQRSSLRVMSTFIEKDNKIYVFHGFTTPGNFDKVVATFEQVMRSFDRLRNKAALKKQPRRVRIKKVDRPGTLEEVLRRFGVKEDELKEMAVLNGMRLEDKVNRGELLKVVR